jgi:hypothetical protein
VQDTAKMTANLIAGSRFPGRWSMRICRSAAGEAVLKLALAAERTGHLGYETHDPAVRGSGNSRNCTTPKTGLTDVGPSTWRCPATATGLLTNHRGAVVDGREAAAKRGRRSEPADV